MGKAVKIILDVNGRSHVKTSRITTKGSEHNHNYNRRRAPKDISFFDQSDKSPDPGLRADNA